MPHPPLTSNERRLSALCRALAALYFAAALGLGISLRSFAADPAISVLALALMTAVATACLVAAADPRQRRHAVLAAVVSQLTAAAVSGALLLGGTRSAALMWVFTLHLPLLLLTSYAYRSAAPGVRSAPAREGPPPPAEEEPPKIQLKVSKS